MYLLAKKFIVYGYFTLYVFFLIRTKNHETKIRYVSYKVHCILLVFPPPLMAFYLAFEQVQEQPEI